MSAPPNLTYGTKTYLTLSTSSPSHVLPTSSSDSDADSPTSASNSQSSQSSQSSHLSTSSLLASLAYVGPVGALPNDHIFSLPIPTQDPPQEEVREVKKWLEMADGVQNVEVMLPKKRSKGTFEC
ncbi:hypothetical protein P7C70_g5567, partial [Phenoliferia sp. Uapishka_3]